MIDARRDDQSLPFDSAELTEDLFRSLDSEWSPASEKTRSQLLRNVKRMLTRHKGPGDHPSGSPQKVHGKKGGEAKYKKIKEEHGEEAADKFAETGEEPEGSTESTGKLKNDYSHYFTSEGDRIVKVADLNAEESDPKRVESALTKMQAAEAGEGAPRGPIRVFEAPDGQLYVIDGNSTTNAARANGLDEVPVEIMDVDSHIADLVKTKDGDPAKLDKRNPQSTWEEHLAAGQENMDSSPDSFQALLDMGEGLSAAIDADVMAYDDVLKKDKLDKPVVMFGPLKGLDRATEKVTDKYGGDWGRLTDVVRATVVADLDDVDQVISQVKAECEERGWEFMEQSVENRFAKPVPSGYRDVAMFARAPNGQTAEIQVNTLPMIKAKKQGHDLYKKERSLAPEVADGTATEEQVREFKEARAAQLSLYSKATAETLREIQDDE